MVPVPFFPHPLDNRESRMGRPVTEFSWQPQPQAAEIVQRLLAGVCEKCPDARRFARRLLDETGTRLIDWIDHLGLPRRSDLARRSRGAGFVSVGKRIARIWATWRPVPQDRRRRRGMRLAIRVESVADFLVAQGIDDVPIEGVPLGPIRKARVGNQAGADVGRGTAWMLPIGKCRSPAAAAGNVLWHQEAFRRRKRRFTQAQDGFESTRDAVRAAVAELGTGLASDLFFAAERGYWTGRNRAARLQKARQDSLGLGSQDHDHHTYRSGRRHFTGLIAILEQLGWCRERFYAGREAGWGAQVLEQEESGIVVFADVDLGPAEVAQDFAHQPLQPRAEFGTVGLWCLLHGEALLQAGMHHLECRFDFDAARRQLQTAGVPVLKPFTDLPYLKQAFTEGEVWPVEAERLEDALAARAVTPDEGDRFRRCGAIGSHLEICNATRATRDSTRPASTRSFERPIRGGNPARRRASRVSRSASRRHTRV